MNSDPGDATVNPDPDSAPELASGEAQGGEGSLAEVVESLDLGEELRAIVQDVRPCSAGSGRGARPGRGETGPRGRDQLETRGFSLTVWDEPYLVRVGQGGLVDAECTCDRFAIGGVRHVWAALVVPPNGAGRLAGRADRGPQGRPGSAGTSGCGGEAAGVGASPWEALGARPSCAPIRPASLPG